MVACLAEGTDGNDRLAGNGGRDRLFGGVGDDRIFGGASGDWLYGERNAGRPMLHAAELAMTHPLTNEPLRVSASVPDDFRQAAEERRIVSRGEDIMTAAESS